MRVLLTGGGTGGHITPLLAVAQKLKGADASTEVIYVGERGSRFASMTKDQKVFDSQYSVFAGKFRRYNGESWLRRLFDVKTNFLNLRDVLFVGLGTIECWFLLRRLKPDVILLKGGFVGVPVGLAARNRIPMVTHDSDALPSLANRLVSRWARIHATGMPAKYYNYPTGKIQHVGVLVSDNYTEVTATLMETYRRDLKLPTDAQILMITGGSLGSQVINQAVAAFIPQLLKDMPSLQVIHQVGRGNLGLYGDFTDEHLAVYDLMPYDDLYKYTGSADVIVTRAGANTLAEFGIQAKACIVVPNPLLTGGHQLINATYLSEQKAAVVVTEADLNQQLRPQVESLLASKSERQQLGEHLHQITISDAAHKLAAILTEVGKGKG